MVLTRALSHGIPTENPKGKRPSWDRGMPNPWSSPPRKNKHGSRFTLQWLLVKIRPLQKNSGCHQAGKGLNLCECHSVTQHLCSKLFKFWGETPRKITGAGTGGCCGWDLRSYSPVDPESLARNLKHAGQATFGRWFVYWQLRLVLRSVSEKSWRTVLCQMLFDACCIPPPIKVVTPVTPLIRFYQPITGIWIHIIYI